MSKAILLKTVILVTIVIAQARQNYHVIYQWNIIEPEWPNEETHEKSLNNGSYIPENNVITGIKLWKDQLYLTIPRMRPGVPATLTITPATPEQTLIKTEHGLQNLNIVSPKLKPFPNWEMQKLGDCRAFQFIQSMEIDPMGRMWIIDNGRIDILTDKPNNTCPPRLVILDLEADGKILKNYIFPKDVADYNSVLLNDIVLDHEHGGFAYITDNGSKDPGLIVYSLSTNSSWKIRHGTMKGEDEARKFSVNKVQVDSNGAIDGIALSPSSRYDRMVYYSPLSSFNIYSIPTAVLKSGLTNVNDFVRRIGRKESQTGGMIMTSAGMLIFGLLANNSVAFLNTSPEIFGQFSDEDEKILAKDDNVLQWPESFAIDEDGHLWCLTNNWQNFMANKIDSNSTNYRVIKFIIRSRNYQYFEDGSAPILPISHLEASRSVYGIPVSISLSNGEFPIVGGNFK